VTNCLIRIRDVSELLQQPLGQLEHELQRKRIPVHEYRCQATVDWQQLTHFLGEQRFGKLMKAAVERHFDFQHFTWTVASFPALLAQWDQKRNRSLKPNEVTFSSMARAVWWLCPAASNHSWQLVPGKRVFRREDGTYRTTGCPFCSHHRSTPRHSLASEFPAISKQWHSERNRPLGRRDVAPMSRKEV
jgi:hypothetical protein